MADPIKYQVQEILNRVFDEDADKLKTVSAGSAGTSVTITETIPTDATKTNASMTVAEVVNGTVTTKTLTKTIGAASYVKTVASDSSDNSVTVSTWAAV